MQLIRWTAAVATVLVLATATTAEAAPVTVGSPLIGEVEKGKAEPGAGGTFVNLAFGETGARPTSPVTGAVISWHVLNGTGPFRLRVLRPAGGTSYTAAASSGTVIASGSGIETFQAAVPIQAGDAIGLDINGGNEIGIFSGDPADVAGVWIPSIPDGATQPFLASENEIEVAYNAVVQPAPTLAAIAPSSGPIGGGTAVAIVGTEFANVTGVSFGGMPATFTVASEGLINAIAPPTKKAGPVDVVVTTVAGSTPVSAIAGFNYKACVVPKLKTKSLKAAKKQSHKAGCKVGKVTKRDGATAKSGKVVKQGPKPRKVLAPGTKINITLG
jgi:hypothetical protein